MNPDLKKWASEIVGGYPLDRRALQLLAERAGEDASLFMGSAVRIIMDGTNSDCDRAWRILDRLEKRGLIATLYADGLPMVVTLTPTEACHAL